MLDSNFLKFKNSNFLIFDLKNDFVRDIINFDSGFKFCAYLLELIFGPQALTVKVVIQCK